MCGISGFIEPSNSAEPAELEATITRMIRTLRHRGPDDQGTWVDASAGLALGHRRLAILDLSAEGHQPMRSAGGRYVLAFNGEIYNFRSLRRELEALGHAFRGHSDTEVLLAAVCAWGLEAAVQHFVGMFAFALWDRRQRCLHLVRDRMGEKPLYYGWSNGVLLFGSELKALRAHPKWRAEVDRGALALFMRHNYIPAPYSIYQSVFKLTPGCILSLSGSQFATRQLPAPKAYWSLRSVAAAGLAEPFVGSEPAAKERLTQLLRESIAQQMIADVPLGAFLSGGIDSSVVVALMQAQSRFPIHTFSIGFAEERYNEAGHAQAVARHLGTEHTELFLTPRDLQAVLPRLPGIYDEPFSDASQIPTLLLCELARQHVTVSLSGDAGDELFGGYEHYAKAEQVWRLLRGLPSRVRGVLGQSLSAMAQRGLDSRIRPGRSTEILNRVSNFAGLWPAATDRQLYHHLISPCREPETWLKQAKEPPTHFDDRAAWQQFPEFRQRMMYLDSVSYLPDDILVKVDRAAMAVSLETRIPLLDHRLVEFTWRLPAGLKHKAGHAKWLLRQILYQYVPRPLVDRPKQGFGVPMADWLRGPLRAWAEHLLAEKRLRQQGFFQEKVIRQKWTEHLSKKRNWGQSLWSVLMFQAWQESQHAPSKPNPQDMPRTRTSVLSPVICPV